MEGFHDEEALRALTEQVVDALRPLGITVAPESVQFGISGQQMMIGLQGLVRPEARERADEDTDTREEFSKMMAENHRAMLAEKEEEISKLVDDPEALAKWLLEDETECSHERVHEGLCLDCHATI